MFRKVLIVVVYFVLTTVLSSPVKAQVGAPQRAVLGAEREGVKAELFVGGLDNPWGMGFLPSGEILITERDGRLRIVKNGKLLKQSVSGLPKVYDKGQGGLLDIVLHPEFEKNSLIYLSFSEPNVTEAGANTSILRAKFVDMQLREKKVIYRAGPKTNSKHHFGSRFAFDKSNNLFFSIGDRGNRDLNPQSLSRDGGKIYRLKDDGSVPKDNPFISESSAISAIFSYGHRNPQGLAIHPETGELWSHEHGPKGGDELNIIEAGRNYGWPKVTFGKNYDGSIISKRSTVDGVVSPITYWDPSIAPCGMTFVDSSKYPEWKGQLLVGSLKFSHLVLLKLKGHSVVSQQKVAVGIGRVRNVAQSPDGFIYVGVQGSGLYRLRPAP